MLEPFQGFGMFGMYFVKMYLLINTLSSEMELIWRRSEEINTQLKESEYLKYLSGVQKNDFDQW